MSEGGPTRDANGRWVKGYTPNPTGAGGGRPPGTSLPRLKEEVERALMHVENGKPRVQLLAEKLVELAIAGDIRAADLIARRLWPERLAFEGALPLVVLRDFTGQREALDAEVIREPLEPLNGFVPTLPSEAGS